MKHSNKKNTIIYNRIISIIVGIVMFIGGFWCGSFYESNINSKNKSNSDIKMSHNDKKEDISDDKEEITQKETTSKADEDVLEILDSMTLDEKIYQMFFVTPESITNVSQVVKAGSATKKAIEDYPVGGIIYFSNNFQSIEQTKEMIKNTQSYSKIPLFIGVDEEGGIVQRLGSNPNMKTHKIEPMKEIADNGDKEDAYNVGKTLAEDLKKLGFNLDFAPVADLLINPDNTEIGNRSFGTDTQKVSIMVSGVVEGLEENGVSAVLKHFPGHGSTKDNSHNGYSKSTRTIEELRENEFIPFKVGINSGVDFVMISHLTPVNVIDEDIPASLSKEIITDYLINELGFDGVVITDALNMGAISKNYSVEESSVMAVKAGVDMLLMPTDIKKAHLAIKTAIKNKEISEEQINKSVEKILKCKKDRGLLK